MEFKYRLSSTRPKRGTCIIFGKVVTLDQLDAIPIHVQ